MIDFFPSYTLLLVLNPWADSFFSDMGFIVALSLILAYYISIPICFAIELKSISDPNSAIEFRK